MGRLGSGAESARKNTRQPATNDAPSTRSKVGRPSKYNPDLHPPLAEAWAAAGKTEAEIAEKFGVCLDTITEWKTRHPAFSVSLKAGKDDPDDQVEQSLFRKAIGGDTVACIFWLKNRRPAQWRDKQDHALSNPDGSPLFSRIERVIVKPSA